MSVTSHHLQRLPSAKLLDTAQIDPGHDEAAGESMSVPVPRVVCEPTRILAGFREGQLGPLDGPREELAGLGIATQEHAFRGVPRVLTM